LVLAGHSDFIAGIVFSHDGKSVATASGDRCVKVWDAVTGKNTLTLQPHNVWVFAVLFSADDSQLVTGDIARVGGTEDKFIGELKWWDSRTGKLIRTQHGHENGVLTLAYNPVRKQIASGSVDGSIIVWDPKTDKVLRHIQGHRGDVFDLSFSPDGGTLASAARDGTVKVWDLTSRKEARTFRGHKGRVLAVRYNPDATLLVSAGNEYVQDRRDFRGELRIWNAQSGDYLTGITDDTAGIYSVAFSRDGKLLATGHGDGTVKIWDVAKLLEQRWSK
jgi:WD40 repeat protein